MGFLSDWFKKEKDEHQMPFMEHPGGAFETAVDAMEDAVRRLRSLPTWDRWITFCAQGQGPRPESYHMAEVCLLSDKLAVDDDVLNLPEIIEFAGCSASALAVDGDGYSVGNASPREVARILDAIFRVHFQMQPFPDEGDDYAVGAEW